MKADCIKKFNRNRWTLGFFRKENLDAVLAGDTTRIRTMEYADRTRWFADPFILSADKDTIIVLAEELEYSVNRGRIARLEIDSETFRLKKWETVLSLPTHLSFPFVVRRDDKVYVLPENSASGKSVLYEYDDDRRKFTPAAVIAEEPFTDATICTVGKELFLFSTKIPEQNGNTLHIYRLDRDFKAHPHQTVEFGSCIARNAGAPFVHSDMMIRPAQDCNGDYGTGVILQKIVYDEESDLFTFEDKWSIRPFLYDYHKGLHTLNRHEDLFVTDMRGFLYPTTGRIIRPIFNLGHKISGK